MNDTRLCSVTSCSDEHYAKGYCCKHYARVKKHGDPNFVRETVVKPCSVAGCHAKAISRGFCRLHYQRMHRLGTVALPHKPTTVERFEARLADTPDGCRVWTGSVNKDGYGILGVNRRTRLAHRFAWEIVNGSVPPGMLVCHRCDNPSCCNPVHLFLGTQQDNMSDMAQKGRSSGQRKTHCLHGHEFTPENTNLTRRGSDGRYQRRCRECVRITGKRRRGVD